MFRLVSDLTVDTGIAHLIYLQLSTQNCSTQIVLEASLVVYYIHFVFRTQKKSFKETYLARCGIEADVSGFKIFLAEALTLFYRPRH